MATCHHPFLSPVSHPSPFHFLYVFWGLRNFSVVKNLFFTPLVKCHMFNVARHYVILPIFPRVRHIAMATKNKTLLLICESLRIYLFIYLFLFYDIPNRT